MIRTPFGLVAVIGVDPTVDCALGPDGRSVTMVAKRPDGTVVATAWLADAETNRKAWAKLTRALRHALK